MKLIRAYNLAPLAALLASLMGLLVAQHTPLRGTLAASLMLGSTSDAEEAPTFVPQRPLAWERLLESPIEKLDPLPPQRIDTETLWLARCIYSETKRAQEQELVAWVIRNRVETGYRGSSSYREAVLDPYQFSAFNPGDRKRRQLMSLDAASRAKGWQQALRVAHRVRSQTGLMRPFSIQTRHFFSERSMPNEAHPYWAETHKLVRPANAPGVDARRFRFYRDIS